MQRIFKGEKETTRRKSYILVVAMFKPGVSMGTSALEEEIVNVRPVLNSL